MLSDDQRRALERYTSGDGAMAALGVELVEVAEGRAVTSMVVRADACDRRRVLARGNAFTLADAAIAVASNSYGPVALLVHADVEWQGDAVVGAVVTARCEVVERSERTATFLSRLTDEHGVAVGTVLGTTRSPRP